MIEKQLFQIIRHYVNNEPVKAEIDWKQVWKLAKKHSLGQFVCSYMYELPAEKRPEETLQRIISNYQAMMVVCQANQDFAAEKIHSSLEEKKCFHLFIKGSVTKYRYPDSFYRSMGDIDFLYRESQHELVKASLLENGFSDYERGRKNDTDYMRPYVCVEAHRQLVPSDSSFFDYCSDVWTRAKLVKGNKYYYAMTLEDEFIFNIIHLAIHFLEGGAGIRFILDVYVYNHLQMDKEYVRKELEKLDLLEFYNNISDLAENWFGNGEATAISEKLSDFVLRNGTFGTKENASALAVKDGRWKHLLKLCFPSYQEMISIYPWLKGKIGILPVAWLIRGFGVLKNKKGKLQAQIKKVKRGNTSIGKNLQDFYLECGLRSKL